MTEIERDKYYSPKVGFVFKRFIVFAYQQYYPGGGFEDACETFDTVEEAKFYIEKECRYDSVDLFDCEKRMLVDW